MAKLSKTGPIVIICDGGRYMELRCVTFEKKNTFGTARMDYVIEGFITDKDLLDADNTVEGAALNAGGIPPEIYLKCPDCAHITAEGHECKQGIFDDFNRADGDLGATGVSWSTQT